MTFHLPILSFLVLAHHTAQWIASNGGVFLGCHPWAVRPHQAICQALYHYTGPSTAGQITGGWELVTYLSWHAPHFPFGHGVANKLVKSLLLFVSG